MFIGSSLLLRGCYCWGTDTSQAYNPRQVQGFLVLQWVQCQLATGKVSEDKTKGWGEIAQCGMLGLTFTRFSPSVPQKQEKSAVYFICLCALKRSVCGGQVLIVEGGSLGLNSGYLAASTLATKPSCQPLLSRIRILFLLPYLFLFGGSVYYMVLVVLELSV